MTPLLIRRLARTLLTLFVASVVVFLLMSVLPGSPASVILGTQATPHALAALNVRLGFDRPLITQYLSWIGGLISFHLGNSYITNSALAPQISHALAVTGPLIALSLLIAVTLSSPLSFYLALRRSTLGGTLISSLSQIGLAVPSFALGLLLIDLFALRVHLLPASGFTPWSTSWTEALRSLALPAISLGLIETATLTKYLTSALTESLDAEYLVYARSRGLSTQQALLHHGWRNALPSLTTVLGLEIGGLLVGAVVVESVFTLPGIGSLLLNAVQNRDLLLVQDLVMIAVLFVTVVNGVIDLTAHLLDPRLERR
jgi:peptide/nickel transport system permease protein